MRQRCLRKLAAFTTAAQEDDDLFYGSLDDSLADASTLPNGCPRMVFRRLNSRVALFNRVVLNREVCFAFHYAPPVHAIASAEDHARCSTTTLPSNCSPVSVFGKL